MLKSALLLVVLCAPGLEAQRSLVYDTVAVTPALDRVLATLTEQSVERYCAPRYRRIARNIYIDSLAPALVTNPDCTPREALILIRPVCAFTVREFLTLQVRALYVLMICRPDAVGIPMSAAR